MTDTIEVLIASDASGSSCSSAVWDINTGTSIHSYKSGGATTPGTIDSINNDYIIAAERLKPLLHLWPVNSQEPAKNIRLVCPGKVRTLAISSNGIFCAAGIDEKLYIWQISSGKLLAIAGKHFQPISKVLFTIDDSHVITAGDDGLVLVWPLANLVSQTNDFISQSVAGQTDPIHTISDHSMPIKDMCIGKSGLNTRLVTVSSDRTMKLYQIVSGTLLLSVVFDVCLTAVVLNLSETCAYVGTADGSIMEISFLNPPRNREYHVNKTENNLFKGHTKSISCLSISVDGRTLASGSIDEQVIVWHVQTKQRIRTIPHKGAITNVRFMISSKNMFSHDLKPTTIVNPFQRSTESDLEDVIEVINSKSHLKLAANDLLMDQWNEQYSGKGEGGKDVASLIDEINKLKTINAKLYQFGLNRIVAIDSIGKDDSSEKSNKRKRISMPNN